MRSPVHYLLLATLSASFTYGETINWKGYNWVLRDEESSGPGPNKWIPGNVWIDGKDNVHLKITRSSSGEWSCAELYTNVEFGFGTYRWLVEGPIDRFDPNVVLGLFTYLSSDHDSTNEIDIEIAKWGETASEAYNLFYTVYPAEPTVERVWDGKRIALGGTYTTHQFKWTKDYVSFQSQHGHKTSPSEEDVFFSYQTPQNFTPHMPVLSVPLHMNLWNFKGRAPTDGKEVEIVVHDFTYTRE